MAGRRRPVTRQTESIDPISSHVTRQTRQSARRPEPSTESESQHQLEMSRTSTSRRRRKSLESVAMDNSPKGVPKHDGPGLEDQGLLPVKEYTSPQNTPLSGTEDSHVSPEMNADRMQDMLDFDIPKLTRWSGKLYDILSTLDGSKSNVDDQGKLSSYRKSYIHARLPFATGKTPFLKPVHLPEEYDQVVRTKIQGAICSGNLVSLLTLLLDVELGKERPCAVLEQLNDTFPTLFIPAFPEDNDDIKRIFDLAFRVRCRLLVESLVSAGSTTPFEGSFALATGIFCRETIDDADSAREALRKGPYRPLAGIEISDYEIPHRTYRELIQEFMSKFPITDISTFQASLDAKLTQASIFSDIRSWALRMYRQLNKTTGQDKFCHVNATNENSRSRVPIERAESESLFVDNGDGAGDDSNSESDIDIGGYDQLPLQGSSQNYINSSATLTAVRESEEKALMHPILKSPSDQRAVKGKEKASDTRDAIRLLEPGQILGPARKRSWPDGDSDDFEVNEQLLLSEPRGVLNKHATIQRPSSSRPRFSKQPQSSNYQDLSPLAARNRETSSTQPPDDFQDDYNLQGRDILVLSQNARNIRRANHSTKPRQTRTPWSAYDTSRLVDLIADPSLNCSWSAMEKAGGFEHPRNQQALRDKARGLKVWYLEGDRILPPGFDQVALGQKEKDSVIKCGRNPNRREDDLDETGQVTSNIWAG
ncbi:uncharacterized protein GGS22DRAFT_159878 [Annulohypoxylon maeteangense]|uniref:uncharacterized protein n=1 Tax=Annulohypoxylon maeteangense TaxID=1927788 RepID=UPI002008C168|nr:uncharacterized protein GGS22DRAFT_159878 [Annulohypoxylon maeteangense]KAI0886098.1 hypothetical protein GGS22DRAFT_159878 [Annulohypoxylon maeteangense]